MQISCLITFLGSGLELLQDILSENFSRKNLAFGLNRKPTKFQVDPFSQMSRLLVPNLKTYGSNFNK